MSTIMTGAKAIFRINGTQIAYASNVSYNENIQLEPINVLDNVSVLEHAEVGYTVDMQCQTFRVQNESVKQLGLMPVLSKLLLNGELTAEVIDRTSNTVLLLMEGVKLQARQTSVDARGLMTETWQFVGRKASDEAGQ